MKCKIVRYTCAVASVIVLASCKKSEALLCPNESNRAQIEICEKLLNECAECGILDAKGEEIYHEIAKRPSVSRYAELIEECTREDVFFDTVGEGDTWCDYCENVLSFSEKRENNSEMEG